MELQPLTPKEARELRQLQRKWAARSATRKQIMRCRELEQKDAAWVGRNATGR